jgi:hypothetical protein
MPSREHLAFAWILAAVACSPPRDTVEKTTDVHARAPVEDYLHVAKRARSAVALADARGLGEADAKRFVEGWADALEDCSARLQREGKLVAGAARVAIFLDDDGHVVGTKVKTSEEPGVVAITLQCLLLPVKATPFPPGRSDAGARGLAIEAQWSPGAGLHSPAAPSGAAAAADGGSD